MKVIVIGTGTMGLEIIKVLAGAECVDKIDVLLRTVEQKCTIISQVQRYLYKTFGNVDEINFNLDEDLRFHNNTEALHDADFVIEAIDECFAAKKQLLLKLNRVLPKECIYLSNTSSISISLLSSILTSPERLVGFHFFNPASKMDLIEIIGGISSSSVVLKKAEQFASQLGKQSVVVNESPGFIVNRLLIPMINEGIELLANGVASKEDIDKAMKLGAGHPMGPLKLADFIGNDIVLSIMDTMLQETGDTKYRASTLLRNMVRAQKLGRKTKVGFYEY